MSKKIGIQALEWRRLWESPTKYFGTPPRCSWKHLLQSQRKAEKSRLFCSSHFGKERLTLKREPAGKAIGKERSVWASRLDLLKWEEPVMFQYWAALPLLLTPRLSPSIPDVKTQDRKIQFRILSARSPKPHWPLTDPFWPQSCPALEHYGLIGPSRNILQTISKLFISYYNSRKSYFVYTDNNCLHVLNFLIIAVVLFCYFLSTSLHIMTPIRFHHLKLLISSMFGSSPFFCRTNNSTFCTSFNSLSSCLLVLIHIRFND